MAMDRRAPPAVPSWSRLMEWSLVAAVIVTLGLVLGQVLGHQKGEILANAELAAVQSTLGALRTALVIDHLHRTVRAGNDALAPPHNNPFELLERRPTNYQGETSAAQGSGTLAGHWVFDPACVCVGYLPQYPQWFDSPSGETMAWFRVDGAPGPLQLNARENYTWQNTGLR
jgi:hypothetical protein